MRIYDLSKEAAPKGFACAVALGFFDGCHLGHRALLGETLRQARARGIAAAVFTFSSQGMKPGVPLLQKDEERLWQFEEAGMDAVFIADFAAIRTLSPKEFVEKVLLSFCGGVLSLCGENFHFGAKAAGDAALLKALMEERGKEGMILPQVVLEGKTVSSSEVRRALLAGEAQWASRLLGAPYTLSGIVIEGKRLGRTIGIPTANLPLEEKLLHPRSGVYASETVTEGRTYPSITNIGSRPTVEQGAPPNAETHLIGYKGDLYGKRISVRLLRFLREERHFPTLEELCKQMQQDIKEVTK